MNVDDAFRFAHIFLETLVMVPQLFVFRGQRVMLQLRPPLLLDVFSRYVVGWMIAYREAAGLAGQLVEHNCGKQTISPGQLTTPADRGSSMTSKSLALLLADLGVVKTHCQSGAWIEITDII